MGYFDSTIGWQKRARELGTIALLLACPPPLSACGGDGKRNPSNAGDMSSSGSSGIVASGGGSVGSGGGSGKPPEHTVGDCDGLDATEFEAITPPGVNAVLHVLLDPVSSGTVYAGTDAQGIYKSTNCGADWTKANTGVNAEVIDSGQVWSMAIDPVYPQVLYAGSLYAQDNSLFKSTNAGQDFSSLFPKGSEIETTVMYNFLQEVAIDPDENRHGHLVVTFHADCSGPHGPMCMAETFDGGETWRVFKGPTQGWVEDSRPMILGEKTFLYVSWSNGVHFTQDGGATWEEGGRGGNHQMLRIADDLYLMGSAFGMAKSRDGLHWDVIENSPKGDGLATDGERIFTSVRRPEDSTQPFYVSEDNGETWTSLASPDLDDGAVVMRYDPDHHLLYAATTESGLWRMVTH